MVGKVVASFLYNCVCVHKIVKRVERSGNEKK